MRNLIFESIIILSYQEKAARKEAFHPRKNLVVGKNHTGKSSLFKTIYKTLGASPKGKLAKWDENVASLLDVLIGEKKYRFFHQSGNRGAFDSTGTLLFATNDHWAWSKYFAKLTGYNLSLLTKENESTLADVKCYFLPFYIDQDSSWGADFNTFTGLQQFKSAPQHILEYVSGIKPPKYYEYQVERQSTLEQITSLKKEKKFLNKAQERFEKNFPPNRVQIEFSAFETEINRLSEEVNILNGEQQEAREELVKLKELKNNILRQINSSKFALASFEDDKNYLTRQPKTNLTCPTCGAVHNDSFFDFLKYNEDARVLYELINRLRKDLVKIDDEYNKKLSKHKAAKDKYQNILKLLKVRRGALEFKDIIKSVGADQAMQAFSDEVKAINDELKKLLLINDALEDQLKALTNRKRSADILKIFRTTYGNARNSLNLPSEETKRKRLNSRPNLSGSGGPRSILAYYAAIWKVAFSKYGSYQAPIVIDSPNQKAQDELNLPIVHEFIFNELPSQTQLFVGSEVNIELAFDKKISLTEPYHVLSKNFYDELEPVMTSYMNQVYMEIEKQEIATE